MFQVSVSRTGPHIVLLFSFLSTAPGARDLFTENIVKIARQQVGYAVRHRLLSERRQFPE